MLPRKPPISEQSVAEADGDQPVKSQSPDQSAKSPSSTSDNQHLSPGEVEDPPLPSEKPPPLPNEAIPDQEENDDGWEPLWDDNAQAFYFFNRFTNVSQWENPRVPDASSKAPPGVTDAGPPGAESSSLAPSKKPTVAGGYDPAIHGDYDPNADYAKVYERPSENRSDGTAPADGNDATAAYAATGHFNRFTGKWQSADLNPDKFSDESKSKRQMNAFFDVDAAANAHDGKSLKAERSNKKITKKELKAFKEKRREKKEEKRRAWLRD